MNIVDASAVTFEGLAVGLCTYKRLPSLKRLLEHIALAAKPLARPPQVIVVDNDGNDPAVGEAVIEFGQRTGLVVHHLVERRPGISAARNLVFDTADWLKVRFVAMIDDDEWPSEAWLSALLSEQESTGATVVGGPVAPVFPEGADHLQRHARYWSVQQQTLDGRPFVFCTCNFLIDMAAIASSPRRGRGTSGDRPRSRDRGCCRGTGRSRRPPCAGASRARGPRARSG